MAGAISHVRPGASAQPVSEPPPPSRGLGGRIPRLAWVGLGLGLLVGAYAWLGFRWVPHLLRTQAVEFVRAEYGRKLSLGEIQVHPFAFTLDVRDVALPDQDGRPMLGLGRLFIDFEAAESLFRWAYVFDRISLVGPAVHAVVRADGQLNLSMLAGDAPAEETSDGSLPRVRVHHFSVHAADAQFTDRDRPEPFHQRVSPLSFSLREFATTGDDGRLKLSARLPEGAQLSWKGSLRMQPQVESKGDVAISHVSLVQLAEFLGRSVPCTVSRGWVGLAGSYSLQVKEAVQGKVDLDYIKVTEVGLRRRGGSKDEVHLPAVHVQGVHADLAKSSLRVGAVEVLEPRATAVLEQDGRVSLQRLASAPGRDETTAASAASGDGSGAPWKVELGRFEVQRGQLDFVDAALAPGTRMTLRPIDLTAEGLSLDPTRNVPVTFETAIDGKGTIRASGQIRPAPLTATLDVDVEEIALTLGQPYLDRLASITLNGGTLSSHGRVTLGKANPDSEELVFEGDLGVRDVRAFDNAQRRPLLGFSSFRVEGIRHAVGPDSLHIGQIVLDRPYARVVISKKGDLNVASAFDPNPEAKPLPSEALARATAKAERQDDPATAGLTLEERILIAGAKLPISIDTVRVRNMRLNFTDELVDPDFAADIRNLTGSVRRLSTAERTHARLRLDGRVATGSPVHIRGTLRPFAFDKYSTIDLDFENVSLPIFNPYSATFAGYAIARGELSAKLHYELRNRALEANHAVRIDHLQWGDKTETKQKASLPVRLATALLRDRQGVIALDLPVEGTMDDPEFKIWPIVWQVVKNVIVKAVAAPFDLLGKAFKGAEDARYVDFAPGDASLDDAQRKALASLSSALRERDDLRVEVPVGTIPALDEQGLRKQKFDKLMRQATGAGSKSSAAALASLPPDEQLDALTDVYRQLTGRAPSLAEAPASTEGLSRRQAREATTLHQAKVLAEQTRESVPVDPGELSTLGERRAEVIEQAILKDSKLAASRVLLSTKSEITEDQGKVRFELKVE